MAKQLKLFFKRKSQNFEPKVHHCSSSTIITLYDDEELYMKRTSSVEDFIPAPAPLMDVSTLKSHSTSSLLAEVNGTCQEQDEMNKPTKVSLLDIFDNWIWMEMKNSQTQVNEM